MELEKASIKTPGARFYCRVPIAKSFVKNQISDSCPPEITVNLRTSVAAAVVSPIVAKNSQAILSSHVFSLPSFPPSKGRKLDLTVKRGDNEVLDHVT